MQARSHPALLAVCLVVGIIHIGLQPVLAQSAKTYTVDRAARSKIDFVWNINQDCSVIRGFNVSIARVPKHGEVTLEKVEEAITAEWNERGMEALVAKCMGQVVPVITIFYTPNPGAPTSDSMKIIITNPVKTTSTAVEIRLRLR